MPEVLSAPSPVVACPHCGDSHWRCVWCLPRDCKRHPKPSGWEQQRLRNDEWATLCVRCARKRLNNPWNALLPMRKRGA